MVEFMPKLDCARMAKPIISTTVVTTRALPTVENAYLTAPSGVSLCSLLALRYFCFLDFFSAWYFECRREVAEIVGAEGLQDTDHLLMYSAERVRQEFLCQNSFTEDAFSTPEQTIARINAILRHYENAGRRLAQGEYLETILKDMGP